MPPSMFGCNQKNLFGAKAKANVRGEPEPVTLVADPSQVITAIIPFQTKNAALIRQHMHSNITENGQKIFLYRQVNGWTNISLESTETAPKLTSCDPITTLKVAWREFNACNVVSKVIVKWSGSDEELGFDDIDHMEDKFMPLPEADDSTTNNAGGSKTDAEVLYDMIDAIGKQVTKIEAAVEQNQVGITHIVSVLEQANLAGVNERFNDGGKDNGQSAICTPTTNSQGKRRARS